MRRSILTGLLIVFLLPSCNKDNGVDTSGIATINNNLLLNQQTQNYYLYGFLFSKGELVSSESVPPPDIIVDTDGTKLSLEANNLQNSFFLVDEYVSESLAKNAFNSLTSATVSQWAGSATPLRTNQIWLFRSGTERYAKIRIISTTLDNTKNPDFAECTFQWVYQPDGSLTFPGK
ncbi:MAG: hypothetical protein GT600_07050 [Bacteroidales bacterium]|jgi:hypothetical protein|nr:hypothetical protein [Bacteroidales bacterium]HOU02097.1 hypothetical protein [Bacteroidales bacterium]HQK68117.1 hypothetical protein [Bacteroidales bacterium]